MIRKKCQKCESKDLSSGKNDFLYIEGREVPIQFCNKCHHEWFVFDKKNAPTDKKCEHKKKYGKTIGEYPNDKIQRICQDCGEIIDEVEPKSSGVMI